jgi:cyclophilin family peptidyl-prolyl cis-trans isomerase
MASRLFSTIEPLESRIAPANVFPSLIHPLPDIIAGPGKTGATVDLSAMFDSSIAVANRTVVKLTTNFDADPLTAGIQGDIYIELYDDLAPLTVQNFLAYAFNKNENGDYDGTFFHRLASGFVLQGGGFQFDGKEVDHIDTLPTVHNEFDASRSNLRGTIALAKTGLGPNTGTSEWFVNLNDNSGNLDNQNGGFTVFARVLDTPGVVDGMAVIDKIAQLPTNAVVQGFDAPVQNYDSDPDDNPSTPAPKPTQDQLIRILDVTTVANPTGDTTGLSYSVDVKQVVNGAPTSLPSDVVSGAVIGNKLNLSYADGKAGVAQVNVTISKAGEASVTESFFVKVQPNLITDFADDTLLPSVVPGEVFKVKLNLSNTGGAAADGSVDVKFSLAPYIFSSGSYVPDTSLSPIPLNSITKTVDIGSGKSLSLTANVEISSSLNLVDGTVYKLVADVSTNEGFNGTELFADDNSTLNGELHQLNNQFGDFETSVAGKRSDAVLTYSEPDGDVVQFMVKGPGGGKLLKAADGSVSLELSGTTQKTKLLAKVTDGDGDIAIKNFDVLGTIASAKLDRVDLSGNISLPGGIKSLKLGDITGPSTLSLSLFTTKESQKANLSFGSVKDLSIDSIQPINSIKALEWLDTTGGADSITTDALGSLKITGNAAIRGDLEANVNVSGGGATKEIRVAGLLNDATVRLSGNVGTVSLGGMVDSTLLAGSSVVPDSADDFTDALRISNFTIRGVDGVADAFANSTVAADTLNNVTVRDIDADAGGPDYGFIADAIKSYNRVGGAKLNNLAQPGTFDQIGQYSVTIV